MVQTTNEVLAGRDCLVYTEPWLSSNTFPADNAWGVTPGGSWTDAGWTKDGVAVRWRQQIQEYTVDQILDALTALPLSRDMRFVANLGQVDMPTLVVSTSSGSATGILAGNASGTADYMLGVNPQNLYYSIFFDIRNPISNDFAHFVGWRTRGVGDLDIHIHLADIAQVNMEMRCFPDTGTTPARVAQLRLQMNV